MLPRRLVVAFGSMAMLTTAMVPAVSLAAGYDPASDMNSMYNTTLYSGVERRAQVQRLKAAACELAQGFFFARPLVAETLAAEFARDNAQALGSDRMARSIAAESRAA
ncbi:MAG: hypothetical protein M3O78_01705 [Chloroflexota bacterium]|nr:hypothetical protein [Chloroflexota bacterium]